MAGEIRPEERIPPGPGQESVWDYPRPPTTERSTRHVKVLFNGEVTAETERAIRVLETSPAPTYYIPPEDVRRNILEKTATRTRCEWKGEAHYFDVCGGSRVAHEAAFAYPEPTEAFDELHGYIAFYPDKVECRVDGERVRPQAGGYYAGWITHEVVGPFAGAAGEEGYEG